MIMVNHDKGFAEMLQHPAFRKSPRTDDRMPVVLGDVERWLNLDTTLDDVDPLGPERFVVRAVNPAVNKVSEKNIDAIERAA